MASRVIKKRNEYFAYGSVLEAVSQGLYPDRRHILREFVQNAYDSLADFRARTPTARLEPVEITSAAPSIIIADKGIGMSRETMRRYRYLGFSAKQIGVHAGFRGIGKFSAISACDRLIVRSSRVGERKSYQVEIDAAGMFKRLKEERNPPLEALLQEYSQITEGNEGSESHYTVVELHSIHDDAKDLLNSDLVRPYLMETAPVPFDPDFAYGEEIGDRLRQVDKNFLDVPLLLNGSAVYKPFLPKATRPDFQTVFAPDSDQLLAFSWSCQNQEKGQFLEATSDGKSRRHPNSGLRFRMSNFAIGDSGLVRRTFWDASPERAFYFFGEIHVFDTEIVPTSDRDNFEDSSARGRLYKECREIAKALNKYAALESQQHRFVEMVAKGQELVSETEKELQTGQVEKELKEDKEYQVEKVLQDLSKRLRQSGKKKPNEKVIKKAQSVIRKAERLKRRLRTTGSGKLEFVDISKELRMNAGAKAVYECIIEVLREEFRQEPQRFRSVVRKVHQALRQGV
jgi:hypothetical protein